MFYICQCGNKEFERALEPAKPLQTGVTPPKSTTFLRCANRNCHRPFTQALELKPKCTECDATDFHPDGTVEVGNVINGKMFPGEKISIFKCIKCSKEFSKNDLEDIATAQAYVNGIIS